MNKKGRKISKSIKKQRRKAFHLNFLRLLFWTVVIKLFGPSRILLPLLLIMPTCFKTFLSTQINFAFLKSNRSLLQIQKPFVLSNTAVLIIQSVESTNQMFTVEKNEVGTKISKTNHTEIHFQQKEKM